MDQKAAIRSVRGLESIIDAFAGVLAEKSLQSTLREMARALKPIVGYTSLAIYEVDWEARRLEPVFAEGLWVEQTLGESPALDDSITGTAVLSREVVNLEPDHPLLHRHHMPGTPVDEREAMLVAPLMADGRPIGTLNLWREGDDTVCFTPEDAELARRFATLAAIAYANAGQRERLRRQALTDELTGLANRRHFLAALGTELARARREGSSVALVLLDLDDFKAINDTHGHACGDETLRAFSVALGEEVRAGDIACRTGGEEFAVILPNTGPGEAAGCAERLLAAVRRTPAPAGIRITASAGVAVANDGDTVESIFRAADERLLTAKAHGKDRVTA
jgi:diguanylate cyclase (GGDEF)-like protein